MKDVLQLEMFEISRDFITHIQIKKCTNALAFHIIFLKVIPTRLLRDSHLDLEIETLKENSHLILHLDS